MKENILPQTPQPTSQLPKSKISIVGIILTIILSIVLITLGERIIFDLNKALNPYVEKTQSVNHRYGYGSLMETERSFLSKQTIYYPWVESANYLKYKVLINAGFIVPIFLITFLFYYLFNIKGKVSHLRVVSYGYLVFSLWMIIHLVINLAQLALQEFPQLALYLILIFFATIFTVLAVFIQKKINQYDQ